MGLKLFRSALAGKKRKYVTIRQCSLGKVRISGRAIELLVKKIATGIAGVQEAKVKITAMFPSINIEVQVTVLHQSNLPSLSKSVQARIKEEIFEITGIQLRKVKVSIDKLTPQKPRVK